jgi:hypothetical protein
MGGVFLSKSFLYLISKNVAVYDAGGTPARAISTMGSRQHMPIQLLKSLSML